MVSVRSRAITILVTRIVFYFWICPRKSLQNHKAEGFRRQRSYPASIREIRTEKCWTICDGPLLNSRCKIVTVDPFVKRKMKIFKKKLRFSIASSYVWVFTFGNVPFNDKSQNITYQQRRFINFSEVGGKFFFFFVTRMSTESFNGMVTNLLVCHSFRENI